MNFQPPLTVRRRMYIDGMSIIKTSVIPLQPVQRYKEIPVREPVLAHRVIPVSHANRLGLPRPMHGQTAVAHMRKLITVVQPTAVSAADSIRYACQNAIAGMVGVAAALSRKNWQAFVPGRYKKYTVYNGVQVTRAFKGQGVTALAAVLLVTAACFWPGAVSPQAGSVAASDAAAKTRTSAVIPTPTVVASDAPAVSEAVQPDVSNSSSEWTISPPAQKQTLLPTTPANVVTHPVAAVQAVAVAPVDGTPVESVDNTTPATTASEGATDTPTGDNDPDTTPTTDPEPVSKPDQGKPATTTTNPQQPATGVSDPTDVQTSPETTTPVSSPVPDTDSAAQN